MRVDAVARGLINRDHERDKRYRSRYGITAGTVDQLRARQGYRCAICDRHESQLPRGLAVDHDHATGYVRALLCLTCNTAIGLLEENADVLRAAIHYLLRAEELAASVHNET
ncbi:hypothetical protein JOD54_001086 [Actinokineospora baliensis]|uniref:endonuclease VII domain-containing protein n=1 Tax=Actinokineospora baliensis TaxID=547056 RepID=UPI001957537B|nr:endonuclease VII domain-containing protein [Actinokineospora baliensis]MBM7770882.1 hypothetical protein [Actinokineospora baliensis]